MNLKTLGWLTAVALAAAGNPAHADEADDLQMMIERERRGIDDLRQLDDLRAVGKDIALVEKWLNESWKLRGEEEYDRARAVLDRVDIQKDMVREKITAARLKADAAKVEAKLKKAKKRIKALKKEMRELAEKKSGIGGKAQ